VKRFRGGLVFKAHSLLYQSTLGLRVIKIKKKVSERSGDAVIRVPRVDGLVGTQPKAGYNAYRMCPVQTFGHVGTNLGRQGQNLALTVVCVPYSLDSGQSEM